MIARSLKKIALIIKYVYLLTLILDFVLPVNLDIN